MLQYTFREANFCVDFLVKKGSSSRDCLLELPDPPVGMTYLLLADFIGVRVPRL